MSIILYARTSANEGLASQRLQAEAAGFHVDAAFEDDENICNLNTFFNRPGGRLLMAGFLPGGTLLVRWLNVFGPLDEAIKTVIALTDRGIIVKTILLNASFDSDAHSLRLHAIRKSLEGQWRIMSHLTKSAAIPPVVKGVSSPNLGRRRKAPGKPQSDDDSAG